MLAFVYETNPDDSALRNWLTSNTAAESDSTIKTYVGFQRSIGFLTIQDAQYHPTTRGAAFAETGDPELVFEALLDNVAGFETILQTLDSQTATATEIQAHLREAFPEYQLPEAVVSRHLEWLRAPNAIEQDQQSDHSELTPFGTQLLRETIDQTPTIDDLGIGNTVGTVVDTP